MGLEIEVIEIEIADGVADKAVDGSDNTDYDAKSDHEPEPAFHVDDLE